MPHPNPTPDIPETKLPLKANCHALIKHSFGHSVILLFPVSHPDKIFHKSTHWLIFYRSETPIKKISGSRILKCLFGTISLTGQLTTSEPENPGIADFLHCG